jgi:hypothetical protein
MCIDVDIIHIMALAPQLEESAARNNSVMRGRVRGSIRDAVVAEIRSSSGALGDVTLSDPTDID